jgi:hypothetical protein
MPKTPLLQEPAIPVEDLDARVLAVTYVDSLTINHDGMRLIEV